MGNLIKILAPVVIPVLIKAILGDDDNDKKK